VWQGNNYSKLTQSTYQIRIQGTFNPKYTVFSLISELEKNGLIIIVKECPNCKTIFRLLHPQ